MDSNKGFLLEIIRNKIINHLKHYKSVYAGSLPLDSSGLSINYSIDTSSVSKKDTSVKTSSIPPENTQIIEPSEMKNIEALDQISDIVKNCKLCDLHKTRLNTVPGAGSSNADVVIIGEAPGAEEDKTGLPFVGRSGKLLTKMLEAIDLSRDDVFICNVLKCRPPNNRDPKANEINKCSKYLDRQLELLKPKYILALGRIAAKRILEIDLSMKDFRRQMHSYKNIPVMVTYHPSALLRNPKWKYSAWEDLKQLRANLDK